MIALILAGGTGTRLWPLSRTMSPKQFLNLGNENESLLSETYHRISPIINNEDIYFIGSKNHELELSKQIFAMASDFPEDNILLEPEGKNTAPAILWGLTQIPEERRGEAVVILPADHLIREGEKFTEYLKQGEKLALQNRIVTFGITPDRPDTGFGYIKFTKKLEVGYEVDRFAEKPDLKTAEQYIASRQYVWNAGIFMASAHCLIDEYRKHCKKLIDAFIPKPDDSNEVKNISIESIYNQIKSDSFDYAILEKAENIAVIPIDVGWSDLGSWESIYQISPKDSDGNVQRGNAILQGCNNSLVFSNKKLIACVGIKNMLVVDTDDAILICDLSQSQEVKKLVDTLKAEKRDEYQFHATVDRPWGSYSILFESPGFKIKLITVNPQKRISLQRHYHRSEHWVVVSGTAEVTRGEKTEFLTENESTYITKTEIHRLRNPGKFPLEIIEVQQGDYLGEDDIERFDDDFGRIKS